MENWANWTNVKRYIMETSYDVEGNRNVLLKEWNLLTRVYEVIEKFSYEWRAEKRIYELQKIAVQNNEDVIYYRPKKTN